MFAEAPWLTRRDELNVLEEQFDELCRRHDASTHDDAWEAEEAVIREQSDTEDASEAELTGRVGPGWLEPGEGCSHDHHGHAEHAAAPPVPVRDWLSRDLDRDPSYARALAWGASAYRWAITRYARERHPHLFRVAVNACLVPMKMSYALNEFVFEDSYALDVSDKEFELSATYLSRAKASLTALHAEGVLPADRIALIKGTDAVARDIREARERIARNRKFRSDGSQPV